MNEIRKSYLFLGFSIPEDEMKEVFEIDSFPQIQTHKFIWNVIKGLEFYDAFDITYISSRPVSEFPSYPKRVIKSNKWSVRMFEKDIVIYEIPFINTSFLKVMTRFVSSFIYSFRHFKRKRNKAGIIVYSVHVPYMLSGYLMSKLFKIDYIAIWTDPPSVKSIKDSSLKSKLRNVELVFSQYLMQKATKIIALTKFLAEDFAPGVPYVVMEGIVDVEEYDKFSRTEKVYREKVEKIVYTGSLDKRYGIKNLVEGFIKLNLSDIVLEIYGRGDFEEELREISEYCLNIIYKGYVSNSEILLIQRDADLLINTRSRLDYISKYSFPSKTLEYMLSGTPLISTILPGMPNQYSDYLFPIENNTPECISNRLASLIKSSNFDFCRIGRLGRDFAETKDFKVQGKRLVEFLTVDNMQEEKRKS